MANNIIRRVWNQNRMVNIEDLTGAAFQAESGGHTFEISGIDDTGAAVALSGTVSGVFRRPDNADIALTGSASDGVVSVTLSEDCYAVPGRFGLTIFVTSNSQKVAVYACVGTVAVSSTGNVAGDTPANVEDLLDAIDAAIADLNSAIGQIPASYANVMAAIAPTYSGSALYPVGSYAWYNGSLYRCTTAITTTESWTAAHWTLANLGNDATDLNRAISQNTTDDYSGGTLLVADIPVKNTRYYDLWNAPKPGTFTVTNVGSIGGVLGATKLDGSYAHLFVFDAGTTEGTVTISEQYKSIGFYGYNVGTAKLFFKGEGYTELYNAISNGISSNYDQKVTELASGIYEIEAIKTTTVSTASVRVYDIWLPPAPGVYVVENIGSVSFVLGGIKENGSTIDLLVFNSSYPKTQTVTITDTLKSIGVYGYTTGEVKFKISGKVFNDIDALRGKKIMFFGDSITADENRYRKWLLQNTGMELVESFAVSGATLTNDNDTTMDGNPSYGHNNTVPNQVQKLINGAYSTVPDIVVVSAGTNDYYGKFTGGLVESQFAVPDGTVYSLAVYTDVDTCDLTTPSGAMRWIAEKIWSKYSNAQIFFATPIQRATYPSLYSYLKYKHDTITEIAQRMSCCVIDATYKSGIYSRYENNGASGKYLADGLHPNTDGGKLLAKCYEDEIRSNLHYVEPES